jgi:hypothetical protein
MVKANDRKYIIRSLFFHTHFNYIYADKKQETTYIANRPLFFKFSSVPAILPVNSSCYNGTNATIEGQKS